MMIRGHHQDQKEGCLDRSNPLNDFDDIHFLELFCMSKENAAEIIGLLRPKLSGDSVRGTPILPSLQVLA